MSGYLQFEPCDQCGHRSFVFVELPSRQELSFCGAHFRAAEPKLTAMGADILDLRYLLTDDRDG
jgi:hypothetical protein